MQHTSLSDEELVSRIASLCLEGRRLVAGLIVHLIEVEDRALDKKSACSSMWAFCTERLKMSEGETSRRLKGSMRWFVGNIEPKDLYAAKADVVVADGFVGNIAIKMAEATADFLFRNLREEIPKTTRGKIGGLLISGGVRKLRARIDWREFGGAPLLGIDGVAVVAHGRSDARAIKNAIRVAKEAVENQLVGKIRAEVGKS